MDREIDEVMETGVNGDERLADDILEGAEAAAAETGFTPRSIYHMVRTGQIPHTRVGAKLIFRKSELRRRFSGEVAVA